jgi:hypothetical protein
MDGTIIEHAIEEHQKYIIHKCGRAGWENLFSSCSAAFFTIWAVTLARPVYFGTEATPLSSRRGEKGKIQYGHYSSYKNVATALFLLNKVFNSIYIHRNPHQECLKEKVFMLEVSLKSRRHSLRVIP